ncbi:GGDEF domain protein [Imhoffiella purpurea]|uniref:diguanylate cyclase n=1 Tax=Imhoffiella purpurea TaxID=1249627 RepID=W9VX07_9GAMM|nr:GGDEF domain protein [Imhoffiella purpurea]
MVVIALTLTILIPVMHFNLERHFIAGILATLSEYSAKQIMEKVIARNPTLWSYEDPRFVGLLRREALGRQVRQAVYKQDGTLLIALGRHPDPPTIKERAPLFDAGVPVGYLETSASLEPTLRISLTIALFMALGGSIAILLFDVFPLRQLRRAESRIHYLAEHDPLTGLLNRYVVEPRFEQEMHRAERYGLQLSLILFDIDHFKRINDCFGHTKGDAVLRQLSLLAERHIRSSDTLVRWGGEEFLVISTHTDLTMAREQAEKLRRIVERADFGIGQKVTISLGVSTCEPRSSLQTCVDRADAALYRAKCEGHNRCALALPEDCEQ